MSVIQRLKESCDPLDNELATVLEHFQDQKRKKGAHPGLGYEPRDILAEGSVKVISRRVMKGAVGFEVVDPQLSYEALVLKYKEEFSVPVIQAARQRLSETKPFDERNIHFFIKTSMSNFFGESPLPGPREAWLGKRITIPRFRKKDTDCEQYLESAFRAFVWFHTMPKEGQAGEGLAGIVSCGPISVPGRVAEVLDSYLFAYPLGKEFLNANGNADNFAKRIHKSRGTYIWPVTEEDVEFLMDSVTDKAEENYESRRDQNLSDVVDPNICSRALQLVVVRLGQQRFRKKLLSQGPVQCAVTGTTQEEALEAAHIRPYSSGHPGRDRTENGLLLRADIHRLFDRHLISINPDTLKVEVSTEVQDKEYQKFGGVALERVVDLGCISEHYSQFTGGLG